MSPPVNSLDLVQESSCLDEGDTKARLLTAAVAIFADEGFRGSSMRAITRLAGTSVSAAHYHFGSKEELLRAALRETVAPLAARRIQRLDELEEHADGEPLLIEDVFDALIRPVFELGEEAPPPRLNYQRLAARLYADPGAVVEKIRGEIFGPQMSRFRHCLERISPNVDPQKIDWAFRLAFGVIVNAVAGGLLEARSGGGRLEFDDPGLIDRLVGFSAAGYRSAVDGRVAVVSPRGDEVKSTPTRSGGPTS